MKNMAIQVTFGDHSTFPKGHHLFNNENNITSVGLIELIPLMTYIELFIFSNNPVRHNYCDVQCT